MWQNKGLAIDAAVSAASLAKLLVHGRIFYTRMLQWWESLTWQRQICSPYREADGHVTMCTLAVLYEAQTPKTRFATS